MSTLARQWELFAILPQAREGLTVDDIHKRLANQGFTVSRRTIERDLVMLRELFMVGEQDAHRPARWMRSKSTFDLASLTTEAALALVLLARSSSALLPPFVAEQMKPLFDLASRKLNELGEQSPLHAWPKKVAVVDAGLPGMAPKLNAEHLRILQDALLADQLIKVAYRASGRSRAVWHLLHPLGLVQRGQVLYLVAVIRKKPQPRPLPFAVHRIMEVSRTYQDAGPAEGLSLQAFLEMGGMQFGELNRDLVQLRAWVSDKLVAHLHDVPLGEDQALSPCEQGGAILQVTLPQTWQLEWWILSKGASIKVLEPLPLMLKIRDEIRAAARHYACTDSQP